MSKKLLDILIDDEKKINKKLYSSGPYWDYKNRKTLYEIKKKGINEFRGYKTGIGTSYCDNLVVDINNELNFKGRIVASFFKLPLIKNIFELQVQNSKNLSKMYLEKLNIACRKDESVSKLVNKYVLEKTTEFDCVDKFTLNGKDYSTHYLRIANRIENLSKNFEFKKIRSFFEIGGGFGSNIHFLISNFKNIKKIIYLDIVPNIYVGTEYLRHFYKEKVYDYSNLRSLDKISFSNNDNLEIYCVPPWLIDKLDVKIDHFHNAASFVEMPDIIINNYVKFINKFETKEISLISYDEHDNNTTKNPTNLNNFFNNKLKISTFNQIISLRKDIYLTSK